MRTYTIVVEPEEGGGYFVTVPALPGCFTRGRSVEALSIVGGVRVPRITDETAHAAC